MERPALKKPDTEGDVMMCDESKEAASGWAGE